MKTSILTSAISTSQIVLAVTAVLFFGQSLQAANKALVIDGPASVNFTDTQFLNGATAGAAGPGNSAVATTDVIFFNGSTTTTLTNDLVGATFNGFTFNGATNPATALTIGGNAFTLAGNIVNNSTSTQTFSSGMNITTAVGRTFTTATGGGNLVFNNNITQTAGGGSTFNGAGTSTLAGTNSFAFATADNHFNVTGGSVNITGTTTVSGTNTSAGALRTSAGTTVTVSTGGTLNVNGNNTNKADTIIGLGGAASNLTVAGGNLSYGANSGIFLGNTGTGNGVLNVTSGTATFTLGTASAAFVGLGRQNATGTINLNGGTLATGRTFGRNGGSNADNGTANFNFNGGTLQALDNNSDWLNSTTRVNALGANLNLYALTATTVKVGGAIIDTNTFNVGINTNLAHDSTLGATLDGGLTKTGAGSLILGNAANTYNGATNVTGGQLLVSGALTGTTSVAVSSGATLTANGAINAAAAVALSGTLQGTSSVGAVTASSSSAMVSPGSAGLTTAGNLSTGNLTVTGGAHLALELGRSSAGVSTVGDGSDRVRVTGAVNLTGADLALTLQTGTGYAIGMNDVVYLIANDASDVITGAFASLNGGAAILTEGSTFNLSGQDFTITYAANFEGNSYTAGNDVALMAVPEPSTFALLVGAAGVLGFSRRHRRRSALCVRD